MSERTSVIKPPLPEFLRRIDPPIYLLATGFLVLATVLLLGAWLCDDAFITFRTIENFCSGHGLRWNIAERVQSYTHPLWMFCLTGARWLTGELYYTTMILSMILSLAAAAVLALKVARTHMAGVLALLALMWSRAFMDYSSSGLENPLTHLLLAAFVLVYLRPTTRRTLFLLSLLTALCALNRLDLLVLLGPALLWRIGPRPRRLLPVLLGLTPLVAWEVFSVIYYGFPVANTAYAKLQSGLSLSDYLARGWIYLGVCAKQDPLTIGLILAALTVPIWRRWRDGMIISLGLALYLIYILRIGGDFMLGRFLATPLFVSVALLSATDWQPSRRTLWVTSLAILTVGLFSPRPTLLTDTHYGQDTNHMVHISGIADERDFYYPSTGLLRTPRGEHDVEHRWADMARGVANARPRPIEGGSIGFFGYYVSPQWHIVDVFGLADPLLARLPAIEQDDWRIGHHMREIPEGYLASTQGAVRLTDPALDRYYRDLRLVTRGPLWRQARWAAIWRLNTTPAPGI